MSRLTILLSWLLPAFFLAYDLALVRQPTERLGYLQWLLSGLRSWRRPSAWLILGLAAAGLALFSFCLGKGRRDDWPGAVKKILLACLPLLLFPPAAGLFFLAGLPRTILLQHFFVFLFCLAAAAGVSLFDFGLDRPKSRKWFWLILIVFAAGYTAASVLRHYSLFSRTWDLSFFDNVFWNSWHGRFWHSDINGHNYLGEHLNLILVPFLPLYLIWPNPTVLLILNSLVLVLSAWPLHRLGEKKGLPAGLNLSVTLAYLLYLPFFGVLISDFHELAFAPVLILWALYFLEEKKTGWFLFFIGLSFLVKENVLLNGVFIGLYLALGKRRWALGLALAAFSLAAFQAYTHLLVPALTGEPYPYFTDRYGELGDSAKEIVVFSINDPARVIAGVLGDHRKVNYLGQVFYPLLFLPLLSGWTVLLFLMPLASIMLASFPVVFISVFTQYGASYFPFLFYALVLVLAGWQSRYRQRLAAVFLAGYAVAAMYLWGQLPLVSQNTHPDIYKITAETVNFWKMKAHIPSHASVSVTRNLGPHLSQRRDFEVFSYGQYDGQDYILVDLEYARDDEISRLIRVLKRRQYGVIDFDGRFVVLKLGAETGRNQALLSYLEE